MADNTILTRLDGLKLKYEEIGQKLAGFIRDSFLNAGYSRRMLGHFNFHRQYVQASLALQVGSRRFPHRWIHHFNDIALAYLLESTTKKLPAYMVCHEKLLNLKYESENSQSQLYRPSAAIWKISRASPGPPGPSTSTGAPCCTGWKKLPGS